MGGGSWFERRRRKNNQPRRWGRGESAKAPGRGRGSWFERRRPNNNQPRHGGGVVSRDAWGSSSRPDAGRGTMAITTGEDQSPLKRSLEERPAIDVRLRRRLHGTEGRNEGGIDAARQCARRIGIRGGGGHRLLLLLLIVVVVVIVVFVYRSTWTSSSFEDAPPDRDRNPECGTEHT